MWVNERENGESMQAAVLDLDRAIRARCTRKAKAYLENLRESPEQHRTFLGLMRQQLEEGGLTLADIGSSEEEVEALRVQGCADMARGWARHLYNPIATREMRARLAEGGLTLADIGLSEEEVNRRRWERFR